MLVNLRHVPNIRLSDFGYPDTAEPVLVECLQGDGYQIHRIEYNGAPAALFDNAPNGSTLWRTTAGTGELYLKTGTLGKADGAWVKVAVV